ncbi:MAG: AAA family ATPase [Planctomycetes bacterium]|nr:AAA family ATPase [Planctomycetota bacterium]
MKGPSRGGAGGRRAGARGAGGKLPGGKLPKLPAGKLPGRGQPAKAARPPARARAGRGGGGPGHATALLSPAELRWTCRPIQPSGRPPKAAFLLGQERPMAALRTGLSIHAPGYNLFVSGLIGSGRTAVVEQLLRDIQPVCRRVPDRVFVHNFQEPNRPLLVSLPAGRAAAFCAELQELGRTLLASLVAALRSRPHRMSRRVVRRAGSGRERRIMEALQRQAQKQGCALVRFQAQNGLATADIYPVVEGEPITLDALSSLVIEGKIEEPQRTRLMQQREQLLERLDEVNERVREEQHRVEGELRAMDRQLAFKVLQSHTRNFQSRWPQAEVADWLDTAGEFVERNLHRFLGGDGDGEEDNHKLVDATAMLAEEPRIAEFQANIVKTSLNDACPVVIETNPTYGNLFGTISAPVEGAVPGPANVHPGAMLRAEGGYLILRCLDVVRENGVWPQLKRTLQTGRLEIREFDQGAGTQTGSLQPEAIPLDIKVVLIGEPGVYEQLAAEDAQFPQIFKIHAEFDGTIAVDDENLTRYADYVHWLAGSERLRPFGPDAMAAIAEYGARAAGRRDRLITRYSELGDLAREAAHLCEQSGAGTVTRMHVERTVQMQRRRHDLPQELTERDYESGYMRLSTSGTQLGQINALTVLDTGTIEFGRPCRITCNSGVATAQQSGLVNIEGLANLSGPIHNKGIMILEGFLLQEFGREGPLCMQATICFEQLYNGVEGDSASLAQLLALLSSLGSVPLLQELAITGSVNQKGEVQAVAAVNEKIEGFYRLCRARSLTGKQGVVLPRANVGDLMLDREVVDAVARGEFSVSAVATVGEAIETFTGMAPNEVLARVRATLQQFREIAGRS